MAGHAAAAGVNLIQIRNSDAMPDACFSLTRAVIAAVAGTGARVVVTIRTDVRLARWCRRSAPQCSFDTDGHGSGRSSRRVF